MTGPLEGIRVVDLSRQMAAPYATVMLADFGADVLKVESTPKGDGSRNIGPRVGGAAGESALYLMWNRGKRSLAIDMRTPEGIDVVRRLATEADVFVESYRPGVIDKMGLSYETLSADNPRLVYCSLSAFGQDGPLAGGPGTDPVVQGLSGLMHLTGERDGPPVLAGLPVADFTGAMTLFQGVLLALYARERTGRGQRVNISMLHALVFGLTTRLADYLATGNEPTRNGSAHSLVAPYEAFATADGYIVAGTWGEVAWPRFCLAIERADLENDPRFATNPLRLENREELNGIIEPILRSKTSAEWQEQFAEHSALFGEVLTVGQVLEHPHVRAAGIVSSSTHPTLGELTQITPPVLLSDTPGVVAAAPPRYGEGGTETLEAWGFDSGEVGALVDKGVIVRGGDQ